MRFPIQDLTTKYISRSYQDLLQQYPSSSNYYVLDGLGNVVFIIPSSSLGQVLITSDVTSSMTVASASISNVYQVYQLTSSLASSSISSSHALISDYSINSTYSDSSSISITAIESTYSDTSSLSIYSLYAGTSSVAVSSSTSLTASYALNGGGVSLGTGSAYPFTSSWAANAVTSSHAISSDSSDFALVAGNTLFTASYSVTASYALNGGGSGGTSLGTGSTYPFTSSWSLIALTASYISVIPSGSTESSSYSITSSVALEVINSGLSVPRYDYSLVEYDGPINQWSKVYYRNGGISGSIVSVITAIYSSSLFIGISKSLS